MLQESHKDNSVNIYKSVQPFDWTLIPYITIIMRTTKNIMSPVMITMKYIFDILIILFYYIQEKLNSKKWKNSKVTTGNFLIIVLWKQIIS